MSRWKMLAVLLFVLLLFCFCPLAEGEIIDSGSCGRNANWTLNDEGVLEITGTGKIDESFGWRNNYDLIKSIRVQEGITQIVRYAFGDLPNLSDVILPNSIRIIDEYLFYSCENLSNIEIPDSVTSIEGYAFAYCDSLEQITIPNSVINIKGQAFWYAGLTSVTIPRNVASLEEGAFFGCHNLQNINVSSENTKYASVDGILFDKNKTEIVLFPGGRTGNYTIPDSVDTIGEQAFNGCSLSGVVIPNSVTGIGNLAFGNSDNLASVTIPSSIGELSTQMFYLCPSLTNVTIPYGITRIGYYAFAKCENLESVEIPDSVTDIENSAFKECTYLSSVIIPDAVTKIEPHTFQGCEALTEVSIPNKVTSIGEDAFRSCTSLEKIRIPKSVTIIDLDAFAFCRNLESVDYSGKRTEWDAINILDGNEDLTAAEIHCYPTNILHLPNTLTAIEKETFAGVSGTEAVFIPSSVNRIEPDAIDAGLAIIAPAGSYAETWANEHDFKVYNP